MKRLWLVRLGRHGENEDIALERGLLVMNNTEDLSQAKDREAVLEIIKTMMPESKPRKQTLLAGSTHNFVNVIASGDIVVSPFKTTSTLGIGEVTGPYQRLEDGRGARPVRWLKTEISRSTFHQDLLFSFGAVLTVCEIKRNDALNRVLAVARTSKDPGDGAAPTSGRPVPPIESVGEDDISETFDLEEIARDQIVRRISSVFSGHEFTRLIAAILTAQGYQTHVSPPGPDAGIDIVAGRGSLGFEPPRLVVQVKSGDIVADHPTLQGLIGCVHDAQADQGLLVSWSGVKPTVRRRTNELFFRVRFWGREEVLDALFSVYDRLPEDIRAELPLRRTWTLVPQDEDGE